jgi:glucose uptake protein
VILPSTQNGALLCLALFLFCWGSWANLQKLTGKWRYELFFFDFTFGVAIVGILAAFTLGSMRPAELTFQDNMLIASYHKMAYALEGGFVLNLSALLLVAAISVAPISIVFPTAVGTGLAVEAVWLLFPPQGSSLLLAGGALLVVVAIVVGAFAYSAYAQEQAAVKKALSPDPRSPAMVANKPPLPATGVALSIISGIAMGLVPALSDVARVGEDGLGAYSAGLLFALAALGSTFLFAPFFITFPVQGVPIQVRTYFKGGKPHLYGLLAGALWCVGLIAKFVSGSALSTVQAGPVAVREFAAGAAVLAALTGFFAWREFRGSSPRIRLLWMVMMFLWIIGAVMITQAPNFAK